LDVVPELELCISELNLSGINVLAIVPIYLKLSFIFIGSIKIIHEKYGTWGEKINYGRKYMGTARVTFLIDEEGIIEEIIEKVKTKDHTAQILK